MNAPLNIPPQDRVAMIVSDAIAAGEDPKETLLTELRKKGASGLLEGCAEIVVKHIRSTGNAAFRAAVKPVRLPSYDRDELEKEVSRAATRRREAASAASADFARLAPVLERSIKVAEEARLALSILDSWTIAGKPLGDCTKREVMAEMQSDHAHASGYMANVRFYAAIVEGIPTDDGVVRAFVSVDKANKLREAVYAE